MTPGSAKQHARAGARHTVAHLGVEGVVDVVVRVEQDELLQGKRSARQAREEAGRWGRVVSAAVGARTKERGRGVTCCSHGDVSASYSKSAT